jgi:hypothetical protein
MSPSQIAGVLAIARMSAGAAFAVAPDRVGYLLVGSDIERPGASLFVAAFGVRDFLLGAGALSAVLDEQSTRPWLVACALADAADAGLVLLGYRNLPAERRLLALGVSAAPAALNTWAATVQQR